MKSIATALGSVLTIGILAQSAWAEEDAGSWVDRVALYGDLRLRYEDIHEEGNPDANRDRERSRARFGIKADVHKNVKIIFGLATGGDNPVSRNVTGDGGFTSKEITLELFYVDWAATDSLNIYAGKMKTPLFRAGKVALIWDSDLNLEGISAKYHAGMFFGNVGRFSAEERSGQDDSVLYIGQLGLVAGLSERTKLTAGLGYFGYSNTIGNQPFYNGAPKGNTVDANGNLVFEYENFELFVQMDTAIGDWPLQLYGHYTVNNEVDRQDTAYAFGAKIGSTKQKGNMQFTWTYQDVEADALIGTFNDSDFGGGGTDASGHIFSGKYMLTDNINVAGTVFLNQVDGFQGGVKRDFNRVQLDVEFSFE